MKLRSITKLLMDPRAIIYILGIILLTISMVMSYHFTLYNSDDVVIQNALLHWKPFTDNVFYGNKDVGFLLQAPIYWLVSFFFEPGRHAMFASGLILSILNFTLVYASTLYFLRVFKVKISYVTLLPIIWLSTFGYDLARLYLGTNLHTLVVGLIFIFLVIISKYCRGEFKFKSNITRVLACIGLIAFIALAVMNDRYFVYFGLLPGLAIAAFYTFKKALSIKRATLLGALSIAGYGASLVSINYFLPKIGLVLGGGVGEPIFVPTDSLIAYSVNSLNSLLSITGANLLGEPASSISAISAIVNLLLVILAFYASFHLLKDLKAKRQPAFEQYVLAGMVWFVLAAYTFSSFNLGVTATYRYLVLIPFLLPVIMSVYVYRNILQHRYKRMIYIVVIIIAIILNLGISILSVNPNRARFGEGNQAKDLTLLDTLEKNGLNKGYGNYWLAHINTYLSKGETVINPTQCMDDAILPHVWFVNRNDFTSESPQTFYLFEKGADNCSEETVIKQFGQPTREISVQDYIVWVYDYDLISKMNTYWLYHTE